MQGIGETAMYGLSVAAHEICLRFFYCTCRSGVFAPKEDDAQRPEIKQWCVQ